MAPWAAFSFIDEVVDTGLDDAPYGTAEPTELSDHAWNAGNLMVITGNRGNTVHHSAEAGGPGQLTTADPSLAQVVLETGNTYRLFPGLRYPGMASRHPCVNCSPGIPESPALTGQQSGPLPAGPEPGPVRTGYLHQ